MPKAITDGIQVEVEIHYRPDRSEPRIPHNFFEYIVHIRNKSKESVQLLNRHWEILESPSIKRIIEGDGVIGEQPILEPRQSHSYSSYCIIYDTIGFMKGLYTFENIANGQEFQVLIPPMNLIVPAILN